LLSFPRLNPPCASILQKVNAFAVQIGISFLKLIYPIANIEACLRNIAMQCDSGDLEPGPSSPGDVDEDNIDVAAVLRVLMELTKGNNVSPCHGG
jgi:hypothetical protein